MKVPHSYFLVIFNMKWQVNLEQGNKIKLLNCIDWEMQGLRYLVVESCVLPMDPDVEIVHVVLMEPLATTCPTTL